MDVWPSHWLAWFPPMGNVDVVLFASFDNPASRKVSHPFPELKWAEGTTLGVLFRKDFDPFLQFREFFINPIPAVYARTNPITTTAKLAANGTRANAINFTAIRALESRHFNPHFGYVNLIFIPLLYHQRIILSIGQSSVSKLFW